MRLHIDNLDGFNEVFETNLRGNEIQDIDIEALKDVQDEDHFWEIVGFYNRQFNVMREEEYLKVLKEIE